MINLKNINLFILQVFVSTENQNWFIQDNLLFGWGVVFIYVGEKVSYLALIIQLVPNIQIYFKHNFEFVIICNLFNCKFVVQVCGQETLDFEVILVFVFDQLFEIIKLKVINIKPAIHKRWLIFHFIRFFKILCVKILFIW